MSHWNQSNTNIAVVGHRGYRTNYPENTIPSFEAARRHRVDIVEFDVNITSDGELIVIHDTTLDRTTNGSGLSREMSFEEIRKLDAGCKFTGDLKFNDIRIPTLREVIEFWLQADYDVIFNVEIKDKSPECTEKTIALLKEYNIDDRYVIACFDADVLRRVHRIDPHIKLQGFPGRLMKNFDTDVYDIMYGMGIPILEKDKALGFSTERSLEDIKFDVEIAKSKGIDPWLYCADTEDRVYKCIECGATTITGNDIMPVINILEKCGLRMK